MENVNSSSLADEVHGLCPEPVGAAQVGEDEVLRCVLHAQSRAQGALAPQAFRITPLMMEGAGVMEWRQQVDKMTLTVLPLTTVVTLCNDT